jgi:6-phosphogluconolactonase
VAGVNVPTIVCRPDSDGVAEAAAEMVAAAVLDIVADRGRCRLAVSGGSTPRRLYRLLAKRRETIPWKQVEMFWGDERLVLPNDDASNYRMVRYALLDHVNIGEIYRMETELGGDAAARRYSDRLGDDGIDIALLGMGSDGHTASLFPHTPGLDNPTERVITTRSPVAPHERVSMTIGTLNSARLVLLLVTGEAKAERLGQAYEEMTTGKPVLPISMIQPAGPLMWIVDKLAAVNLPGVNHD